MSRRTSETYALPPAQKPTNLEKNCTQIFSKGPALTRDIFEKMHKDRRQIMGYEIETKQLWLLSGLLLLFLLSLTGMIAMWFTDAFDNFVFSNLAIVPNQRSFELWQKPTPKPLLKIYLFNYTNVREFERGKAEKLNVQEMGPYVYEETFERVNINVNGSHISYQEHKDYKFMPDLSKGRKQNDRIFMPNIPLFTAAAMNKHAPFLARVGLSGILNSLNARPFLELPAHRIITGYEDNLYALSKSFMKFQNKHIKERFGLLANSLGTRDDVITINNGENDINKVGRLEEVNGESSLSHWSTKECNDFSSATDGTIFSPKTVRNKRPLQVYFKDMCRPLAYNFQRKTTILDGKIPAYRYALSATAYDSPDATPANQCYCDLDSACPPQGVFNATACFLGAPLFTSYPHFHKAEARVREAVTGLKAEPEFESYMDVHPTMGYTMAGKSRVQVNVQVVKPFGISQVKMFEDGMFLPVAWFEYSLEDKTLPEEVVGIIFQTTFTVRSMEVGLKYGCLLTMGVTLFCVILVLKSRWTKRVRTSSIRPLRTEEERV